MKKGVTYHTPGRECVHADRGCCPACYKPMIRHLRFTSREPLPQKDTR